MFRSVLIQQFASAVKVALVMGGNFPPKVSRNSRGSVGYGYFPQELHLVEHLAGALDDAGKGVFGYRHGELRFLAQYYVEVLDERSASGEHYSLVHEVRRELWRGSLEHVLYGLDEGVNGLVQGLPYLARLYREGGRDACDEVRALYLELLGLLLGHGQAEGHLYHFGHSGAYG